MGWDPVKEAKDYGRKFEKEVLDPVKNIGADEALAFAINPATGLQYSGAKASGVPDEIASGVSGAYDDITGKTAAEAAERAGMTQAAAQMEMLDYLKEINAKPQEYKEAALTELAGLYGADGGANQQALIDRAKASPLYQQIMGGQKAGEEAIMRNAAQTGGLRSGNVQSAMYDYNTQLQNQALTQTYGQQLQGLQGLAGLFTNEQQIGQTMANIGKTQAQGIMGQAQAQTQGTENMLNLGLGVAGLFV